MFDSVLAGNTAGARRLGTGTLASIAFHAAVFTAALWFSGRALTNQKEVEKELKFITFQPTQPALQGDPNASSPVAAQVRRPRHSVAIPKIPAVPRPIVPTPPPLLPEDSTLESEVGRTVGAQGNPAGEPIGAPSSTCVGAGCDRNAQREVAGPAAETINFQGNMTPPRILEGEEIAYTSEALEAHVRGTMLVQCTITVEGRVTQCRVLKPVQYMERAVLRALATRRYTPVLFEGKPMPVRYTFAIQLVGPR